MKTQAAQAAPPHASPQRRLGLALLALGVALALNSVLGPLLLDVIDYSLSESIHNQLLGLDAVSLLLVAPLCVVAAMLTFRGRASGPVLALGPAGYVAYMFVQYLVGPGYQRYPGVLTFHLGLFVLGWVTGALAWSQVRTPELPPMEARTRRIRSWVLLGLALFIISRYLPALLGSFTGEPLTGEFRAEPAFFWTILLLDLGIVVPVAVAGAVALRSGWPVAAKAMYGIVGWFALVPPSVAAMAITMLVNDDPNASTAGTILFCAVALVGGLLAARIFRPLVLGRPGGERAST